MTDELKPCPFCGGKPRIYLAKKTYCQLHGDPSQNVKIHCSNKCASRPAVFAGDVFNGGEAKARSEAIAAWNTRADASAQNVRVKPLEWRHITSTGERNVHEAVGLVGRYTIWPDGGWRLRGTYEGGFSPKERTLAAAKAAAQADYEARIRSALEPADAPAHNVRVKPLEWREDKPSGHLMSGIYEINTETNELFVYDKDIGMCSERELMDWTPVQNDTLEAAKAAAYAHKCAAIRAELEPAEPLDDPKVKAPARLAGPPMRS